MSEYYLSCTAVVSEVVNKRIHDQNETIVKLNEIIVKQDNTIRKQNDTILEHYETMVKQNVTLVGQINEITIQNMKIDNKNKLIVEQERKLMEQGIEIKNQNKNIDELQKKVLSLMKPNSCKHIKEVIPNSVSGIYTINVGLYNKQPLEVRCEMDIASGGWTVFHRRYDGSVNFDRNWNDFEYFFGELNGEFWFGLWYLSLVTKYSVNDLRVEMSSFDGTKKYAEYKNFHIADLWRNYKLSFKEGSYSGNAGDSLSDSNGMKFSTPDKDNDECSSFNCADYGGSNWWRNCGSNTINGKYGDNKNKYAKFMYWYSFDNSSRSLKSMTLMFRQVD